MTKTTDFLKATLLAHEEAQRQTGRTTKIALEAIRNNQVMVCHNHGFAHALAEQYKSSGLVTIGLDTFLRDDYHRNRKPQKYVFDHFVEYTMILRKLEEVERQLNERK